ncbi:retrovirus-related pol polyprotein from transposon TNT 1-94 [Tanacetum coccineum]|uniref:Retrovirus-related pol polyprotein from transposon TNT 1-94 n=1 Tax=Tanacetum coccineum TaxID=301880 RepID=A0ABQ5EZT0_9ASTR
MINQVNNWEKANKEQNNESITAELERYKERVKTFEQRLNIDLIFKNESKEKENKYMENEIDLEKKIKELDNIVYKVGQSAQTVHMLTKPQAFYDNTHKQALGGGERTLGSFWEEDSRSKMFEKAKDPEVIAKKISHKPIDYEKLNSLIEDFETRFSPQQELSAEQAFWFHTFNPTIEPSYSPPVRVDVPSELPKKRTTPSALEEVSMQLKQEVFQNDESCIIQNAVELQEYFEINNLKARLQDKDTTISRLKDTIKSLKKNTKEKNVNHDKCDLEPINEELENRKEIIENVVHIPSARPLHAPAFFKLDLVPLPPRSLDHSVSIAQELQKVACILFKDTAPRCITPSTQKVESSNTSYSNTPVLSSTRVKCSTSNCGSMPLDNKTNDRISQTPRRNTKNKVEAQPRKVNKMNHVVKPVCDVDVKQSLSNANSDILCATCNKSMFDGVHDKCLLDLVQNGNNHTKFAKKHKNQNIWKSMGHVFTEVGFKWKPTGRTFTIVGNSCPLTRLSRLYSACALGKTKKTSHQPKAEDTNQEKLYHLHMDLCGPMRVASINRKRYILVIVDDYSRFTWFRFLKTKDEALVAIIKCIKNIQVHLNAIVQNVQTDNGTEFVNQTLREWYENVGITHQTSVSRTP